jgi:hypothetical protein
VAPANGGDGALISLAQAQGFDAQPTTLSRDDFDKAVAEGGHTVMYRGVVGSDEKSAADIHAEVRDGEYRPGYGIFGNGYYMAPDSDKATSFSDGTPGSVGRYALHADANTVTYENVRSEMDKVYETGWKNLSVESQSVLSDFGRFAMSKGYDAIHVPVGTKMLGGALVQREEYVILNRGALLADSG